MFSTSKLIKSACLTLLCLISFLCFLPVLTFSSNDHLLELTAEERSWLAAHPVIRLAPDADFPPLEYFDNDGFYRGIAADFVHLLEQKLPVTFEIVRLPNWSEVINQARSRGVDMLGAATPTPERLQYMRFTRPYVEFPAVVLARADADQFPTLSQLKDERVAVVANYADHEFMKRTYPKVSLDVVPDISSGLRQVSFGKVHAMILNLASASYFIQKDGITNLKVTEDTDFVFDLSFATRSDWPEFASILEKAMKTITAEEKKEILDQWISLGKDPWQLSPVVIISCLAVLLGLILLVILNWNRTLKKEVSERTAELENELAERIQAENEKEQLQLQVHRARKMEALGLLAGGVAHDLNNILAGSVGYSDLLMRKIDKESPLYQYAREIRESGRRAAAVVADLLTVSRDAAGDRRVVNLNGIVRDYLASPEHRVVAARYPEITFQLKLEDELLNLSCSVTHLKKSLMNLIINAAEATINGVVIVATRNRTLDSSDLKHNKVKPGQFVQLSVCDSGTGIATEDLEHIFEPFYTRKKFGHSGTGLGLTVVWNMVQEHQGYIDVVQPQTGTCFELNFPATESPLTETESNPGDHNVQGQGEHILVIDDEKEIQVLAEQMLKTLGYLVSVASSGEDALRFLKDNNVDLIILDMLMEPGINGYETYRRIKVFRPEQKAVIASGFSEGINVQKTQALGAGAYIKKPYILEELGRTIREELQR